MTGRVLIGGGTGFVGRHLKKTLVDSGYAVTLVSRQAGPGRLTWNDITRNGLPDDCTAVINLNGQTILDPFRCFKKNFKEEVFSSRVETTKLLADAITQAKNAPKVFGTISGVSGYKADKQKEYTELSPVEDYDFLSNLVIQWEEAAKLPQELNIRQFTVRSGVVLGRDGGMIQQIYYPFYFGVGGRMGSGSQWLPWIHVTDLVNIFKHGIDNDSVHGVLNGVAPELATNLDFTKTFAAAMRRPAIFPVFDFVVNQVFGSDFAPVVLEGQKVIPTRTLESGYSYVYPTLKSACESLV